MIANAWSRMPHGKNSEPKIPIGSAKYNMRARWVRLTSGGVRWVKAAFLEFEARRSGGAEKKRTMAGTYRSVSCIQAHETPCRLFQHECRALKGTGQDPRLVWDLTPPIGRRC